ncbi:MAG: MFS transporter [Oscillospiraceae bacterium]
MANVKTKAKTWEIALFALNGISSNTAMFMIGYYMFYTQNILGLSAVVVGLIATLMRVFDGVTDPPIGVLIDRTDSKFGRFRPYMLIGCVIVALSIIAIFNAPANLGVMGGYIYTTLFYAVYVIGYTFQTTCTRAAQAVLTKDPKQRPLFAVFNGGFNAILGAAFPLILMTIMAPRYEGKLLNPKLWSHMSFICAGMMFLFSILAIIGISGRDKPENYKSSAKTQKVTFKDMWHVISKNRALQMLVVAASTDKLATMLMGGMKIYLFSNCILNNAMQGTFSSVSVWPVLIISMGGIFLARKFGLKKPFLAGTWGSLICLAAMFVLGAGPTSYIPFLVIWIAQSSMAGITNNILNPMIADCADYEEYCTGKFVPSVVGTVFTFVDKIISSLSTTVIGFALAFAGVSKGKIPVDTFISDKFYWTVLFCICIVPILGHIASIISMKFYPLTTEKMVEIQSELVVRRKKALEEAEETAKQA